MVYPSPPLLLLLLLLAPPGKGSLVPPTSTPTDRGMLSLYTLHLLRQKMDIQTPQLLSTEGQQSLQLAEDFSAQGRHSEALALYLQAARNADAAHRGTVGLLTGLARLHNGQLKEGHSTLQASLGFERENGTGRKHIHAALLIALCGLQTLPAWHRLPSSDMLNNLLRLASSPQLTAQQSSFVLSSYAAFLCGDPKSKAEEAALEALDLDPENSIALHVVGLIYMRKKNYSRSQEKLREAVAIDSSMVHQLALVRCVWAQFETTESKEISPSVMQTFGHLALQHPTSVIFSSALALSHATSKKYPLVVKESNQTLVLLQNQGHLEQAKSMAVLTALTTFLRSAISGKAVKRPVWPSYESAMQQESDSIVQEILAIRFVCMIAQSQYVAASKEIVRYTTAHHPVTASCLVVLAMCLALLTILTIAFGWEGCVIGLFGLILLVLRGVFSMLLLSTIGTIYPIVTDRPFPVYNALMHLF
eukprot:Sspe_Gene.12233::Locus_4160_Transcript_2_2_Confidence_0.429_Length_1619::g.12233::m.12233